MRDRGPFPVVAVERLRRRTDFRAAATGVRASGHAFVVQARRREQDGELAGPARVGFTVSKQVGNAVERNRVRRRLREIVRLSAADALHAGHDYVLIGRRSALALPFGEMRRELDAALNRIHAAGGKGTGDGRQRPLHEQGSSGRRRRKPPQQPR